MKSLKAALAFSKVCSVALAEPRSNVPTSLSSTEPTQSPRYLPSAEAYLVRCPYASHTTITCRLERTSRVLGKIAQTRHTSRCYTLQRQLR